MLSKLGLVVSSVYSRKSLAVIYSSAVALSVCLSVCQQDYSKPAKLNLITPEGDVDHWQF